MKLTIQITGTRKVSDKLETDSPPNVALLFQDIGLLVLVFGVMASDYTARIKVMWGELAIDPSVESPRNTTHKNVLLTVVIAMFLGYWIGVWF